VKSTARGFRLVRRSQAGRHDWRRLGLFNSKERRRAINTVTANTMVVGWFRQSNTQNPSAGAGFTKLVGANFTLLEYKIVNSAQASLSITDGSAGDSNGVIAFAINQASGGGGGGAGLALRLPRRIFVRR
jgi:hypothetical protein